jgi:hypothetical protein
MPINNWVDHERRLAGVLDPESVLAHLANPDGPEVKWIGVGLKSGERRLVGDHWARVLNSLRFLMPSLPLFPFPQVVGDESERSLLLLPL